MNTRIFAVFDQDGRPQGFYPSDVHPIPPEGAVEISHDDWREFLEYQGRRRWDGQKAIECEPATVPADPNPAPPEVQKLGAENRKMNEAIAAAVHGWASLENALAHILGTIIPQGGGSLGMAIYYVPNATETRIAIVDEVITHFLTSYQQGQGVLAHWENIASRIGRCKNTRNKIVHGNVSTVYMNGRNHLRLTAPIFDMGSGNKDRAKMLDGFRRSIEGKGAPQLPGMSAHDVQKAGEHFVEMTAACDKLRLVLSHMQRMRPEPEAFQKKLRELAACLQSDACLPIDDQSPQAREDRPPPSQE